MNSRDTFAKIAFIVLQFRKFRPEYAFFKNVLILLFTSAAWDSGLMTRPI